MEILYETSHRADAVLFWNGNDIAFVYSGNADNADFYHRVSGAGISPVLLLSSVYFCTFY